jgi:hypothetical protein
MNEFAFHWLIRCKVAYFTQVSSLLSETLKGLENTDTILWILYLLRTGEIRQDIACCSQPGNTAKICRTQIYKKTSEVFFSIIYTRGQKVHYYITVQIINKNLVSRPDTAGHKAIVTCHHECG